MESCQLEKEPARPLPACQALGDACAFSGAPTPAASASLGREELKRLIDGAAPNRQARAGPQPFVLERRDGTTVVGALGARGLVLGTDAGPLLVPVPLLKAVTFGDPTKEERDGVSTELGGFTGFLKARTFVLDTKEGRVTVPREQVARLRPASETTEQLEHLLGTADAGSAAFAYAYAVRQGKAALASRILVALDRALGPERPPAKDRTCPGFPAVAGVAPLGAAHLIAAGDEAGTLHAWLLRRTHLVPLGSWGTGAQYLRNRPAIVGATAWLGGQGGASGLYRWDLVTGEKRWVAAVGDVRYSNPLVRGGRVYVMAEGGGADSWNCRTGWEGESPVHLFAVDAETGKVLWRQRLQQEPSGDHSPTWRDGRLFVQGVKPDGQCNGSDLIESEIDPALGKVLGARSLVRRRWEKPPQFLDAKWPDRPVARWRDLECQGHEGPTWDNANGSHVRCRDARTGEERFRQPADAFECVSSEYRPATVVDGLLLVGASCVDLR